MIHPTAIVAPQAEIGSDVEIGAYSVIDGPAKIGAGTKIYPHVYISGWTSLGEACTVHPFAVLGGEPQDFKFSGCESYVQIGDHTSIREYVTVHRGSQPGLITRVGSGCLLMAKSHVAHDCEIGNSVSMANNTECSGHVQVGDNAFLSGHALVHQFARIGRRAMVAPCGLVRFDIPPFLLTDYSGAVARVNVVGARREGLSKEAIEELKQAYKLLYRSGKPFSEALTEFGEQPKCAEVQEMYDFITADSKRGIAGAAGSTGARGARTGLAASVEMDDDE